MASTRTPGVPFVEIELKLALPYADPSALEALLLRLPVLARRRATREQLHNTYFDTPDDVLNHQRTALPPESETSLSILPNQMVSRGSEPTSPAKRFQATLIPETKTFWPKGNVTRSGAAAPAKAAAQRMDSRTGRQ